MLNREDKKTLIGFQKELSNALMDFYDLYDWAKDGKLNHEDTKKLIAVGDKFDKVNDMLKNIILDDTQVRLHAN